MADKRTESRSANGNGNAVRPWLGRERAIDSSGWAPASGPGRAGNGQRAPHHPPAVAEPAAAMPAAGLGDSARTRRARWMSWLFGIALLSGVAAFAAQSDQQLQFHQLLRTAQPAWLLLGLLLQLGTYPAEAGIWQLALRRAGAQRAWRSLVALVLAKLFLDHTLPTAGVSGTLLIVRGLDARAVPRAASMAAIVVSLVSHYAAHVLAAGAAFALIWLRGDFAVLLLAPALAFAALAVALPTLLLVASSGARSLPRFVGRIPLVRSALYAIGEAAPAVAHDRWLIARCTVLQLVIVLFDAATLWAMLRALGLAVDPASVFASFMLSTLARILGVVPGGLGVFEAVSVATLRLLGVPVAAGLAATLLFRGFSFWLPLLPATLFAHREANGKGPLTRE